MGLIQKYIHVKVNNFNQKHFESLGYIVPLNSYIDIPVNQLPDGSGLKIKVQCEYCKRIFDKSYRRYLETKDNICCDECKKYKVENTNLIRYGNRCSLRNENVFKKSRNTTLEKYGVEYSLQNKDIFNRCKKTFILRYGCCTPILSTEIRSKMKDSIKRKNGVIVSKNQIYINNLYHGDINYFIGDICVDIFLKKYNICCEYNGGGHNLAVIHNRISQDDFDLKENKRDLLIIGQGYNCLKIISKRDKLLSDEDMLNILNRAISAFKIYNMYIYNIDEKSEKSFKM